MQGELRQVDRLLKLDPNNTELVAQKQKLLADSVSNTKDKLIQLKEAEKQVQEQVKIGKINEDQYRAFQREISKTEGELKKLDSELKKTQINFDKMANGLKNAGEKMSSAGTKMTVGLTVPLLAVGAAGIKTASDLNEVQNVVDTAFGESSKIVDKWASDTLESFGLTQIQAKEWAGSMRAMLGSSGIANTAADEMSMKLAELAGDFASFYNLDHDVAWEKIRSGISGETEPLKALGINMSVANMEAYALAKGINTAWKDMSQAEQTTLRYNYLLEQTKLAQGDFNKTSEGFANSLRVVKGMLQETAGELMNSLLPALETLLKKVKGAITWFKGLTDEQKQMVITIGMIIAAIGPILIILGKIASAIGSLITLFTTIGPAITAVKASIVALNAMLMANPIYLVIAGIVALIGILVALWNTNEDFRNAVIDIWNSIKDFFVNTFTLIGQWFSNTWNGLVGFIQMTMENIHSLFINGWNSIISFFTQTIPSWINSVIEWIFKIPYNVGFAIGKILGSIAQFYIDMWNWITNDLPKIILGIIDLFASMPSRIWTFLVDIYNKFRLWCQNLITGATTEIPKFIGTIMTFIVELPSKIWGVITAAYNKVVEWGINLINWVNVEIVRFVNRFVEIMLELPGKMLDIGKNIVLGIWEGIQSMAGWLWDQVTSFSKGIVDGVKSALKINSPSKVFADVVGKNMALGIGVGFIDEMKFVKSQMARAIPTNFNTQATGGSPSIGNPTSSSLIQNVTINSPSPLTPSEVARQTRNAGRMLVLGV